MASLLTSQAQTVDARKELAATVNPPIPHARSACVQGVRASLGSPVLQTRPDGAIRTPTTAVVEPWTPTWNCRLSSTWGSTDLASAQTYACDEAASSEKCFLNAKTPSKKKTSFFSKTRLCLNKIFYDENSYLIKGLISYGFYDRFHFIYYFYNSINMDTLHLNAL